MRLIFWLKDIAALVKYRLRVKKMADTILLSPVKYEGLYEPVHRLWGKQKSTANALTEWKIRVCHLHPDSELARFFTRFSAAPIMEKHPERIAGILMRSIRSAGVIRDDPRNHTVDALHASAYFALDGTVIEEGAFLRVISPAWFCNGFVVEHGIAEVL